jgi:acetyltransferase-like isoleucine patch superfamily enzyme
MNPNHENVRNCTTYQFLKGIKQRWRSLIYGYARYIARRRGATIGENVVMSLKLAKKANKNLIVGHNTSFDTISIDLRSPVKIGNYCIIGQCEIITTSHQVDSPDWKIKHYGIEIDDYAWIANRALILPSCRKIGYGAIAGAGSVVVKDIEKMSIVNGNPAAHLRYRTEVHKNCIVESLRGGGL